MTRQSKFSFSFLLSSMVLMGFLVLPAPAATGHFEFSFHYGSWSVNLLKAAIEGVISDAVEGEFKDKFLEDIQIDHPEYVESGYSQTVGFESGDSNFGGEIRWYPAGEMGSFSVGLAVEQTKMRFTLTEVSADLELENTSTHEKAAFNGTVNGEIMIKPLAFLLNVRWDIKPSWRVRPFITFGLGVSTGSAIDKMTLSYSYAGDFSIPGETPEHYEDSAAKTGKELKDEIEADGEKFPLSVLPFLQLNFGLKAALTKNFSLWVEAGILDGFILRGAIAARF